MSDRRKIDYVLHVRRGHLMFTANDSAFEIGGRRPACLSGEEAEAKRLAGWRAAWNTRVRCCGITRSGEQCKNQPMRGRLTCRLHGPPPKSRHPLKKPPTALAMHAREMRRLWRADPWAVGYTVELDPEGQQRLEAWATGVGIRFDWLSPRVQDFARWAYVNSCRSGRHPDDDMRASDTLAERIRAQDGKDGIEWTGHHADRTRESEYFARYRLVPPLGESARRWRDSMRGKPRRVMQLAAAALARDRALVALTTCENRQQAVERQLAIERMRLRDQQQVDARRREQTYSVSRDRGRDGW